MLRPILRYGANVLHEPARPVPDVTDEVRAVIDDMVETMYAAPGIGLAAPQIGLPWRLFVIDLSLGRAAKDLVVVVNPVFESRDGMQLEDEGCLSIPGFNATVPRPERAVVTGLDRAGQPTRVEGTGLLARALQHEMDHLDGRLFVDRLHGLKRDVIVRKIRKLARAGRW
ncbi:MAG: peptide deformylase [Vicinamibacterales bacterium]